MKTAACATCIHPWNSKGAVNGIISHIHVTRPQRTVPNVLRHLPDGPSWRGWGVKWVFRIIRARIWGRWSVAVPQHWGKYYKSFIKNIFRNFYLMCFYPTTNFWYFIFIMKLYFAKIGLFGYSISTCICYTYLIISVKNYIDSLLCKLKQFKDSFLSILSSYIKILQ